MTSRITVLTLAVLTWMIVVVVAVPQQDPVPQQPTSSDTAVSISDDTPVSIFSLITPPQQPASAGDEGSQSGQPTFRVGVEVVNMSVTVTDLKGKSVNGLTKDDFVVLEDNKPREIVNFNAISSKREEAIPFGLGLVVDVSGSMTPERLFSMRTSVDSMLKTWVRKEDQIYLQEFAGTTSLVVDWTHDKNAIMNAIRRIKVRENTAIYDGIAAALPTSAKGKHKKQVMLVITDGADNASKTNRTQLAAQARASDVVIYALVIDEEPGLRGGSQFETRNDQEVRQQAEELRQVTDATGGRTLYVRGFQEIESALKGFAQDFSSQYEIGFQRGAEADGKYHSVRVGVKKTDVTVRHRLGYVAD